MKLTVPNQPSFFRGRVLVWFSCGAASACAAKLTLEQYPDAEILYCDTLAFEHPDNRRFIADVEKANPKYLVFYSHPISWMANPKVKNLIFPWFDKFSAEKYNLIGFADMYDNNTNYVWAPDLDMVNNPPKSQYKIFIFERKSTK